MYTTHIWQVSLAGQAGVVTGRKMLENIDEFVQERLALYTHEEVFEVIIVETGQVAHALETDQAVIVYCFDYQCDLSARAAWRLETMGFQEVYRYTPGKADWLAAGWETEGTEARKVRIRQMIHKDVPTCSLRERLEDVKSRRRPSQDMCIVVNDRNIVLGIIHGETWDANPQSRVADVMQPGPRTIRPDLEPKDAQKLLKNYDASSAIVTTSDGELLGIVKIAQKKAQKARKAA